MELQNEQAKNLVHELYNAIASKKDEQFSEILGVLLKVHARLAKGQDPVPLLNRLVNYLYFTAYTNKLSFLKTEESIIRELAQVGKFAGLNRIYRGDYGDASQF